MAQFSPLQGFLQGQQNVRQQGAQEMAQAQGLMGILAKIKAQEQEQAYRGALSQLGPDATPEQMLSVARPHLNAGSLATLLQNSQNLQENRTARTQDRQMTIDAAGINAAAARDASAARAASEDASRRERQQAGFDQQRAMAQMAAGLRQPPQPQPLVQIMGPDNTPTWVERKDAVGKTPAGAGSKAEASIAGKNDVDKDVVKLKDAIDRLRVGGGITDTEKGSLPNIGAAISSSAVGQIAGGMVGSKNQSARNEMLMIRPSLLRSIMASTGMSAKQMDSNAELKLWLSTATDPTKDHQANIQALNSIAEKYGTGGFLDTAPSKPITGASDRREAPRKSGKRVVVDY